jgi:hypothetical protein
VSVPLNQQHSLAGWLALAESSALELQHKALKAMKARNHLSKLRNIIFIVWSVKKLLHLITI